MARSFSVQERDKIKSALIRECAECWGKLGYKKTSIDDLCRSAGISKGSFYAFFDSKEALFCEVICAVQESMYYSAKAVIDEKQDKYGIVEALKLIYREYDRNNFLYRIDSSDYLTFTNRLTDEQNQRILESSRLNQSLFTEQSYAKFKIDPNKATSVIYSLIMGISVKQFLPYDNVEVFDFMIDHLIDDLYV